MLDIINAVICLHNPELSSLKLKDRFKNQRWIRDGEDISLFIKL